MKIKTLHSWDVSIKDAAKLQLDLKGSLILKNGFRKIKTIAGADMAIMQDVGFAGVIVYSFPELQEIERKSAIVQIKFPYVPGLLAFREGPVLLKAFEKLDNMPDIIMFDGQGIAHPRQLGIASHMGLFLNRPTIGCAKSRLIGEYDEPGQNTGDWSPLTRFGREVIGAVLRTRKDVRPIFVSQGHMIDLQTSVKITLACLDRTRIPKPTREADHFVASIKG